MKTKTKIGIFAGGGSMPVEVVESCRAEGRPVFVFAIEGQTDPAAVEGVPHSWLSMLAFSKALKLAKENDVEDIVMVGKLPRPSLTALRDPIALKLLPKIMAAGTHGDDALLAIINEEIERHGFRVVSPATVMPSLRAPRGPMTRKEPDAETGQSIEIGIAAARTLGRLDIGQSVAVQQRVVIAVEALEGTDAMVARAGGLKLAGAAPVLVKMVKPQQDLRRDPPAIGPGTIDAAVAAGFQGIVVEADGTVIIDREETVRRADAAGLFLVGVTEDS